jgi:hypothetical protein
MISCFEPETGESRDAAFICGANPYFPESGPFHRSPQGKSIVHALMHLAAAPE